jgi:hypothetical protein
MRSDLSNLIIVMALVLCLRACDDGSYADSTGACKQCDISCNTCRSSDGCSTCYDQMYLVARGNLIVCDLCYNVNKGCDICLTGTKCQNCSAGYFLEPDNTCSNCSTLMAHCLLCETGNATYCVSCKNPYQLINGICTDNAAADATNNTLAPTQPPANTQQSQSNASSAQQAPPSPPACDPSQINIGGFCYPTIAFCLSYSQIDGSCIECSSIFTLVSGYCLPSSLASISASQQSASQSGTVNLSTSSAPSTITLPNC